MNAAWNGKALAELYEGEACQHKYSCNTSVSILHV